MRMDDALFETLLYQSEGPDVDFKRDQYEFIGCTDERKRSELLKDILTFANSWRRGDAHILIGVKDLGDGRRKLFGVGDNHIDDASLQQFVNSKTNRPVEFAYEPFVRNGLSFGVIRIPQQARPLYSERDYGLVKKNAVYFRRGSSCAIATPEDVHRMGVGDSERAERRPRVSLEFADLASRIRLGTARTIKIISHESHVTESFPNLERKRTELASLHRTNRAFWRELATYVWLQRRFARVGLSMRNSTGQLAENVRLELTVPESTGLVFTEVGSIPDYPWRSRLLDFQIADPLAALKARPPTATPTVSRFGDYWVVSVNFGSIQPKATAWCDDPLLVSAPKAGAYVLAGKAFGDNLQEPIPCELTIEFKVDHRPALTINELKTIDDEHTLRELRNRGLMENEQMPDAEESADT